jgi:predicted enzyme related to lactoylglutathione lyase/cytidine deaminase
LKRKGLPVDATNKIDYIEIPAQDLTATKRFFSELFGWSFEDYGEEYTSFHDGRLAGGFYKSDKTSSVDTGSVLVVFFHQHLEEVLERVKELGGDITREIFSFPGGRRFHFTDPSGNELPCGRSSQPQIIGSPPVDLIHQARSLAEERYVPGKHQMFCALQTESGNVFVGAHVEAGNGRISLCAEAVAIGAAATAGDTAIKEIVAVTESGDIVPPCGMCRELISDYAPSARVILQIEGETAAIPVSELLSRKYRSEDFPNRRE